jgi:hypothetical protein
MMVTFNCSYRNKNEPTAIYPSLVHPAVRGLVCVDDWAGAESGGSFRAVAPGAV